MNNKKGFTLVELIIVITILAILWTIGFVSYSKYLVWVRDATRENQLIEIWDWLKTAFMKKRLPLPDERVEVRVNGELVAYQWYAWKTVLEIIWYNQSWIDPKTKKHFTYYMTKDRKYFQLLAHLEKDPELALNINFTKSYADIVDYSFKFIKTHWAKLWVLTDEFNTPIQEISSIKTNTYIDLWVENKDEIYLAHIDDVRTYKFKWSVLSNKIKTLAIGWIYRWPDNCAPWFIPVMWDSEFNQKWFCVSKYEMTYSEDDSPWTPDSNDSSYNTYKYDSNKKIAARIDYPIADITQEEAITACQSIWIGYHLILNKEWMTIARQIEFEWENWSSWKPERLYSYIFPWNNDEASAWRWCKDSEWPRSVWTKTWYSSSETCAHIRQLYLFDGTTIWDFAWNVAEHVNKANTIDGTWYNQWNTQLWISNWSWKEMTDVDSGVVNYNEYIPLIWEDGSESMWWVYDLNWRNNNVFLRWGSYYDWYNVWIYTLNLNWNNSDDDSSVWFRCAR